MQEQTLPINVLVMEQRIQSRADSRTAATNDAVQHASCVHYGYGSDIVLVEEKFELRKQISQLEAHYQEAIDRGAKS